LDASLPIHFFTIVLNGEPFIRHHIDVFKKLAFPWRWHVIEGVAALNHDTAWSRHNGGTISPEFHRRGLSVDGTTAYLDALAQSFPQNTSIYRKPDGAFWDGKIEMVRAPLARITEHCLLWQIDADEMWTAEQICEARELFRAHTDKTVAYFYCHYFVGEDLVTTTRDTYGNHTRYEWLRVWRYRPGFQWLTHEPPRLCQQTESGKWTDVASINPFLHAETEARNLVFQHYAYATEDQVRFKETYYGYRGAVNHWKKLQSTETLPLRLDSFFPWVKDGTLVDRPASQKIRPVARRNVLGHWRFRSHEVASHAPEGRASLSPASRTGRGASLSSGSPGRTCPTGSSLREHASPIQEASTGPDTILFVRTDSIGDTILAAGMLAPIRERHPHTKIVVVCQEHVAAIYEACPLVDSVLPIHRQRAIDDADYRNHIARQLQDLRADLCLNSVYAREPLTDFLALASQAQHCVAHEGSTELMSAGVKDRHDRLYSMLISCPERSALEVDRHRGFLEGIGINAPFVQPSIWLKDEDEACAEDFFQRHGLEPESTIALFAGAQADGRVYLRYGEALAEICRPEPKTVCSPLDEPTPLPLPGGDVRSSQGPVPLLGGAKGWVGSLKVIALGSQADYEINQRNLESLPCASRNISGKFTVRESAAILKRCRLAVGAETGLAHIACALGTPNVIVLGGGHFGRFVPYSPLTSIVCLPLECYGCNWQCRYSRPHCVKDIVPKVLKEAIRTTLAEACDKPRVFVQGNSFRQPTPGQPNWKYFAGQLAPSSIAVIRVG